MRLACCRWISDAVAVILILSYHFHRKLPLHVVFRTSWQGRNVVYVVGQFLPHGDDGGISPEAARRRGLAGRGWRQ